MRHCLVIIAVLLATACAAPAPRGGTGDSLVAAELAFARLAGTDGIRSAFLANFADDGVVFEPAPVRVREAWPMRPAPADPRALNLVWTPAISGLARAGDLGYTSGPFTLEAANGSRPAQHGVYFSVWRYADSGWKVVLDAGILTPGPVAPSSLEPAPRLGPAPARAAGLDAVHGVERSLGGGADVARVLAADARLAMDGAPPLIGRDTLRGKVAPNVAFRFTPAGGGAAASDDLAYSFGALMREGKPGFYAHLWTRDATGAWTLAVAIWYDATA